MHGTFRSTGGVPTPTQALHGNGATNASASPPATGKTIKPAEDPRLKAYVDG